MTGKRANMKNLGLLLAGVTLISTIFGWVLNILCNFMVYRHDSGVRYSDDGDYQWADGNQDYDTQVDLFEPVWSYLSIKLLAAAFWSLAIARFLLMLYLRINLRKRYSIGNVGIALNAFYEFFHRIAPLKKPSFFRLIID